MEAEIKDEAQPLNKEGDRGFVEANEEESQVGRQGTMDPLLLADSSQLTATKCADRPDHHISCFGLQDQRGI